jgi:serine/threonine protein phosphatase PrpC
MTATDTVACPSCGAPCSSADAFCEACGTELAPAAVSTGTAEFVPVCPVCSADPDADHSAGVTADGYCGSCGRKVPTGRDHIELDLGPIAGVTDRGLRHSRNEDAMALAMAETAEGPVAIAVVCDGVSSSERSDEASLAAAQAAVRVLLQSARLGDEPGEASLAAVRSAASALVALGTTGVAPSATYVSAVITPGRTNGDSTGDVPAGATGDVPAGATGDVPAGATGDVPAGATGDGPAGGTGGGPVITVCWVGDSRAYWLAAEGSRRLTTDDSVAQEMVASGLLNEAEAMASVHAHVITRWLGADIPDPQAHLIRFEPTGPGVLLVCTDGLWNYLPAAGDLAGRSLPDAVGDPLGVAGALLKFAMDAGGADNITVVLAPVPLD